MRFNSPSLAIFILMAIVIGVAVVALGTDPREGLNAPHDLPATLWMKN
jgi:hypothetical protein